MFKMRPVTLVLTGLPQFVTLVELSCNLDFLFYKHDIGPFKIRDVSCYNGKRKIELDFNSTFDAFAAQSRLDGNVYELPNGQEYTLNAKLLKKKSMTNAINRWRSPSPVESQSNDWNAISLPMMSGEIIEQAHAKLDVQLDLLKKQKMVLEAQKAVLKAKKNLQKEYFKDVTDEKPTTSRVCTTPRNQSRSKSASRERQASPVKHLETPPLETQPKKPKVSHKEEKCEPRIKIYKKSRFWNRSRSRSISHLKTGGSSSKKRTSLSKNRISKSRTPETENRTLSTRNLLSPSKYHRSPPKNRESHSKPRRSSSIKRQSSSSNQRTPSVSQRSLSKSRRSGSIKRQSSSKRHRTPSKNRRSRSMKRSRSKNRRISSRKRRSTSRKRRSTSRKRRSTSRKRRSNSRNLRSRSKSRRWSPKYRRSNSKHRRSSSKNRRCRSRSRIRRSRSKFTRSRSREVRKRWRSRSRDWSRERSPKYSARSKATRTLWSPELYRNRPRSRERVDRMRRFFSKDSPTRLSEYSGLAIMPAPIETMDYPHPIIVKRKYYEAPAPEYFSDLRVTDYYDAEDHSATGIRYICEADKEEYVSKCTELNTNIPNKLADTTDCNWSVTNEEIKETLDPIAQAIEVVVSNPREDNSVVEKPLVDILLGICKDSSVASTSAKTGAIGLNDGKVPDLRVEVDACYTVTDDYNDLDSKTHLSEAPLKGNTKLKENNYVLREIHMRDTNNDDVKQVIDLTRSPEIVETNSSSVHRKFKFSKGPNVDDDIKPVIDLEEISKAIEVKDEVPSILQTPKNYNNFDDDAKSVRNKKNILEMENVNTLPLPKRPKFVIVIRTLMKEMRPSLKKAKHDCMKMSFECKFIYVLRRMLRVLLLGKALMRSSEILTLFREKYPKEQDDQFVRQLVEDMNAGRYGNLGPSDDEIEDGDDVLLVENKHDTVILIDSDDESKPLHPRIGNANNRFSAWARVMNPPIECPPTKPRVLIPYPISMASRTDKENTDQRTEVKLESNDVVPEFTDTELENILKCMKSDPSKNIDGTETPHVTGITIMTSLSELFSLKHGKKETNKEQDIKTEHNALSEEYVKDDALYYNPY